MASVQMTLGSAALLCGVNAGAMLFGSVVEVRTLSELVATNQQSALRQFLPVWWPKGSHLMAPLVAAAAVATGLAYRETKDKRLAWALGLVGAILPYTGLVMKADIVKLLDAAALDDDELNTRVMRFGAMHHARTVASVAAAVLAIQAVSEH